MGKKSEYATKGGVDYGKANPFREAMQNLSKRTLHFPNKRDVFVAKEAVGMHGAIFEYRGPHPHFWCQTQEGLGNLNWPAEWMYQYTGKSYYDVIGYNLAQIIVVDVLSQGGLPVIITDEVASDSYDWGMDKLRSQDFADGLYQACKVCEMALPAGESSALKYLVRSEPPVKSAPVLSGCVTGIIAPKERLITGEKLRSGDKIIAVKSSGLHSNGTGLVIERALTLKDKFLHRLPNDQTLGEATLIFSRSYVKLIEEWLEAELNIHALLPGTGGGLSKLAYDKRPFAYDIYDWFEEIPAIFLFMRELGVTLEDWLTTFNCGGGYYAFVPPSEVEPALDIGEKAGYELMEVGEVKKGERKVFIEPGIFSPESIPLFPPGE